MNDSTPITFSRHGPEGTGLTELEGIPAEALVSGTPVLSGYNYFTDDTGKLTAGVWHATPFTDHPVPSPVNEFMLVLEGSVTIVHDNGSEETIRAGQSFVVPKGMPHSWHSTQDVRKFYATFDDDSGEELDAGALVVRRPDPAAHLDPMDEQDTSRYVGGVPEQGIKVCFRDATGQMLVGVWSTTEMHTRPLPFPRNELMHIVEGEVTITDGAGRAMTYGAGDTFMVPRGMTYQWDSTGTVRKIFCIFQPR